jgi:hypothetical protein
MGNVIEIDNLQFSQYENFWFKFKQILLQDFPPQSLRELEDSLLAEVFACPKVTNKLQNHIADEHDYVKKNDEYHQILQESVTTNHSCELKKEFKTEQCLDTPKFLFIDPKILTKTSFQNKNLSKRERNILTEKPKTMKENKILSKPDQKSLKKFRRKMKNRVSAQESRRKKKEKFGLFGK